MDAIRLEQNPLLKARLIKKYHDDNNVPYTVIARDLDVSPTYISNFLRLLRLPELVFDGFYSGLVSLTHLFILARLKQTDQMMSLYEAILGRNMSALEVEEAVRAILHQTSSKGHEVDDNVIKKIEEKYKTFSEKTKVKVIQTRIKTKVVIELRGNREETSAFLEKIIEE